MLMTSLLVKLHPIGLLKDLYPDPSLGSSILIFFFISIVAFESFC